VALKKRDHLFAFRQQNSTKHTTSVYYYKVPFSTEKTKFGILNFFMCSKHRFLVQKGGSGNVGSMKNDEHVYGGGGGDSEVVEV